MNEHTILKYLDKTASKAEQAAIEAWLEDVPKHEDELEQMKFLWENGALLKDYQVFDKNLAWQKIQQGMEKNTNAKRTAKRIPLSDTPSTSSNGFSLLRIAAMLLLFLGVGILFYSILDSGASSEVVAYQTIQSEDGISKVPLSDGSIVWLNQNSTLKIPTKTFSNKREVILEGEAFFDVAKNPNNPFVIETANANVKVLGTSFNVNNRDIRHVEVVVESGKVQLYSKENVEEQVILQKNDKGVFDNNRVEKVENNNPNFLSWKTGILSFKNQKLADIVPTLSQHYGVDISFGEESSLPNCLITETFDKQPFDSVLGDLEAIFQFTVKRVDGMYVLEGGDCSGL